MMSMFNREKLQALVDEMRISNDFLKAAWIAARHLYGRESQECAQAMNMLALNMSIGTRLSLVLTHGDDVVRVRSELDRLLQMEKFEECRAFLQCSIAKLDALLCTEEELIKSKLATKSTK